jgi:hypothetical protein
MTQLQSSAPIRAWLVIENHHVTGNLVTLRWDALAALEVTKSGNAVPDCEATVGGCRYDGTLMEEEGAAS